MRGGGASPDEVWLAATWPFIRDQLPAPPARVVELGCGQAGGHIPALLRAGYDATGVDPEAPDAPAYRPAVPVSDDEPAREMVECPRCAYRVDAG